MAVGIRQEMAWLPKKISGKNGGLEELAAIDHRPRTEEEKECVLEDGEENKDWEIMKVVKPQECGS